MEELGQGIIQRPQQSRLELLRQWTAANQRSAIAFAIVAVMFLSAMGYIAYSLASENSSQDELQGRIDWLGGIAAISPERLQEVTKENQRILASMPAGDLKETDVYRAVLELADTRRLDIQIRYGGEKPTTVGNTTYRAMSFAMNVSGPDDDVWALLKELDRPPEGLATLVLVKVSLALPVTNISTASADFVVYTNAAGP